MIGFDLVFSERDDIDLERDKSHHRAHRSRVAHRQAAGCRRNQQRSQVFAEAIKNQGTTFVGYPLQVKTLLHSTKISPGFVSKLGNSPAPLAYSLVRPSGGPSPPVPEAIAYLPNLPISIAPRAVPHISILPTDPTRSFVPK